MLGDLNGDARARAADSSADHVGVGGVVMIFIFVQCGRCCCCDHGVVVVTRAA